MTGYEWHQLVDLWYETIERMAVMLLNASKDTGLGLNTGTKLSTWTYDVIKA